MASSMYAVTSSAFFCTPSSLPVKPKRSSWTFTSDPLIRRSALLIKALVSAPLALKLMPSSLTSSGAMTSFLEQEAKKTIIAATKVACIIFFFMIIILISAFDDFIASLPCLPVNGICIYHDGIGSENQGVDILLVHFPSLDRGVRRILHRTQVDYGAV